MSEYAILLIPDIRTNIFKKLLEVCKIHFPIFGNTCWLVWNCSEMLPVFYFENLKGRRLWKPKGRWDGNIKLDGGSACKEFTLRKLPRRFQAVDVFLEASSL
jgi:hypothetical protein